MKNLKFFKSGFCEKLKLLLIPIGLLIGSLTSQVWAYSPVYLNGDFTGGNWGTNGNGSETYQVNYELDGSNSGHYFLPFYTSAGDKYWRFCENNGSAYLNCPATDNSVMNVGTAAYQIEGGHKYNFKSTVDAGIIAVHIHQNYDGKGTSANGSNDRPRVWLERPTIYIWHNWDGNDANWNQNKNACQRAMTDNEDGTYTYDGTYSGSATGTCVGIEGSDAIKKYFSDGDATKVGSPSAGDKCRFKWDASGDFESGQYFGYGSSEQRRGASLTITKILTITYHGNGNEGGSAPSNEEVLYNTATATYTNTGNMTKTNYAFIGWNTQADGRGTHYDAGANITLTTDKDLYAEWVPCWVLRGGNSGSSDGSDAMGDWTPQEMTIIGTNAFMIELTLAANTTYYFKIADRHNGKKADYSTYTHYGNSGTMNGTTLDWNFETSKGNCTLTTGASGGGTWRFAWNASSKYLCVYAPADASKSSFTQGKYIYFDARSNSMWKSSEFKAKFWFKNLATGADDGDIQCFHANALEDWVYYALVPANKTLGSVQMNSRNASTDAFNYDANTIYARGRSNANQNCMVVPSSGGSGVTLSWGTYCPPMSSATLAHNNDANTTTIYGGDGGEDTPYLVATSSNIYVSATSESTVDDDNMTPYYQFKKAGSNDGEESSTATHTYTASGSNGTKEAMTVVARNYYYTTDAFYGTPSPASDAIYYEARTPYSVDVSGLTHMTVASGRTGSAAIVHGVEYVATLDSTVGYNRPTSVTVTCAGSDISAHCTWVKASGVLTIPAAYVTGNIAITAAGVAKTYTDDNNLDKNGGTSHGKYTATYEATSIDINTPPTYTGYTRDGYYGEAGLTTYIADAEGHLQASKNVGGYAVTDEEAQWKRDANITLYTKWTPNPYTLTLDDQFGTTPFYVAVNGGDATIDVTFDSNTNLTSRITPPQREGYIFGGYYTAVDGGGTQIIDANGDVVADASDPSYTYTDASRNWKYAGNLIVYAKWTDDGTYYFSGNNGSSTAWNTASNWTKGVVPGSTSNVILLKPVQVPAGTTTTVNSVKIATSGSYTPDGGSAITAAGKLTIPAEAMLVVTTSVQNSAADGSSTSATTAASLHIEAGNTTTDGNGALVWGTSGTPGYATVDFCTKSHGANSEDDINQYIGTPFANNPTMLNQYYNSWMYKIEYTGGVPNWVRINGDATLNEFEGYNLITAYEVGTVYSMEGQLVSNADVTLNGSSTPKLVYNSAVVGDGYKNENVLANSWVAPIKIMNFEDDNFTNVEKSIYIFNAGSPNDAKTAGTAGNYTTYSLGTVEETDVIPSMQSFSVYTSGATPSLTLDYSELVQKDASNDLIEPNHAPKRYMNDKMDLLKVRVEGDNGWADELKVYIRNDFKSTFEDGWDAHKMYGYPQAPQLYAATADGAMAINCVPTVDNNVVAFQTGSASNEYTMSFAYDGEETIYLNDTKAAVSQEITEDKTYDFTAASGDNVARFTITKTPVYKVPTGMENTEGFTNSASKLMIDGTLYIIRDGRIYNAEGSLVK